MLISKENEDFFYDFLDNKLRFYPSSYEDAPFLPFSLNRPFAVYDISCMSDDQIDALHELMPTALANCLKLGYQIYSFDWQHNLILYDPRNPETYQAIYETSYYLNSKGIACFLGFYPDGDYYFHIDKYGAFGYLSHPWRDEVWIFGNDLLKEVEAIHQKIGFVPKAVLK